MNDDANQKAKEISSKAIASRPILIANFLVSSYAFKLTSLLMFPTPTFLYSSANGSMTSNQV
jgi:uncharacterized membrane protein AbrB (regulator of aidB expression)